MKKIFFITLIAACLLPLAASAGKQLKGSVFSPEQGIICDKKSGFCADKDGIALGFTGEYLGKDAQQKFDKIIASVKHFDTSSFTLSNGIFCDAGKQRCFTDKSGSTVDRAHTEALFGSHSAPPRLKGAVFSPEQGIICDKKSGFCADKDGIALGFTGEYLGEHAQQKFEKVISSVKHFDTTSFTLSNGIFCDAGKQRCFTDKFGTTVDQAHTEALFGR